jgi:hypothetical protein
VDAGRTMSAEKMPTEILPANQAAAACSLDVDSYSYSKKENPRLCRGGSNSLTFPGVCPGLLFLNVGL